MLPCSCTIPPFPFVRIYAAPTFHSLFQFKKYSVHLLINFLSAFVCDYSSLHPFIFHLVFLSFCTFLQIQPLVLFLNFIYISTKILINLPFTFFSHSLHPSFIAHIFSLPLAISLLKNIPLKGRNLCFPLLFNCLYDLICPPCIPLPYFHLFRANQLSCTS